MVALGKVLHFRSWPVRLKIVALLVAASLLPLGASALLELRAARAGLRDGVAELLAARADQLRRQIDAFHLGYQLSVTELARLPALVASCQPAQPDAAERGGPAREIMAVHVASDRNLRDIAVVDPTGKVILATEPRLRGASLAGRAYVRDGLRGVAAISDVQVAGLEQDDTPVIAYVAPVSDRGATIGLVVVWVRASALWDLVRSSRELAGPGSAAVVVDDHGIRIAHSSDDAVVFHPTAALPPAVREALVAQRWFGAGTRQLLDDVRAFPELFARAGAAAPDTGLFLGFAPGDGRWVYGVARRMSTVPWTVFYIQPEREVGRQIAAITRDRVVLVGIIMLAAFGVGLVLAGLILRPVVSLAAATAKISAGDLSARIPPTSGGDELARLCESFNAMADRLERDATALRQSRDDLERRVDDRTAALRGLSETESRARKALEVSAARLETLSRMAHELAAASGDAEVVLELATRRLGETIGDGCAIRLISDDGEWLEPTSICYYPVAEKRALVSQTLASARQRIGEGIVGRVAASGEALLVAEITTERALDLTTTASRRSVEGLGVTSVLAIPLRSRDRTIGVVSLLRSAPGRPYTVDDQWFAQEVADRAGLAIDNAVLVATLERRVAARTAALEAANQELEAFSYSVSHDLRAPLRAIDGFSQVLLADFADQLDPDGQSYLRRVRGATQRMAALVDDLLNLARITRTEFRGTQVDLTSLAAQVIGELRRRDPERTTPIHIAPGVTGRGDERLLTIVLENLLGNAWKFTVRHPHAEIWFGEHHRDDHTVYFVRDTGAGFDMQHADKLFGPFQRLHGASEYEGTGIGLATVHRIITRHGGRIWAEAAVDKGATFYFELGDPQEPARIAGHAGDAGDE